MARFRHEQGAPEHRGPVGIGAIVKTAVKTAAVFPELKGLKRLDAVIRAALPDDLRPHYRIGQCAGGSLTLFADSPVWAARLRYFAPTLLERLAGRPGAPALQTIRVRVLASDPMASLSMSPRIERAPPISRTVAEYLSQAAGSFRDERLRAALFRLAKHGPP